MEWKNSTVQLIGIIDGEGAVEVDLTQRLGVKGMKVWAKCMEAHMHWTPKSESWQTRTHGHGSRKLLVKVLPRLAQAESASIGRPRWVEWHLSCM